ncbi:hypothetical protein [Azospirillum sp.]|uniref:hypothetical protein n=1 Tax=Azospirillum sp. TaxID=34012 RepID=UPI00261C129B|nr:hypothetical protein [Azospirillum sp.]
MKQDDGLANALLARVAASNFDATLFDTNDLSAIRGGSLIALRFPDRIERRLKRERPDLQVKAERTGSRSVPGPVGNHNFVTESGCRSFSSPMTRRKTLPAPRPRTESASPCGSA